MKDLAIYIFSFNRASFLGNCLTSIARYAPRCRISVFDDNSTDPDTQAFLRQLPESVQLIQPEKRLDTRHGGLYANMQLAFQDARDGERILFIQDDMQLVRPLRDDDLRYIDSFFAAYSNAAFLNPVFLKGQRHRRDQRITRLDARFPVYFRHYPRKKNARGLAYADVVIADVDRLRAANWHFEQGEVGNANRAQQLFGSMGFMMYPFVMFLPLVPVYRGKRKTLGVSIAERRLGTQPHVFRPMSDADLQALFQRKLSILPAAERFLHCDAPVVKKPFEYSAVNAFPLLYALHKLELWLRRK